MPTARPLAVAATAALALLTSCSSSSGGSTGASYSVQAGDSACTVKPTRIPSGDATFTVHNVGSDVTEVYVYGKQGASFSQVVGEVENVGPGTTQDLSVSLQPGTYQVACKPGMTGDGIRTTLKVTSTSQG